MIRFMFDLQRFADVCKIGDVYYSSVGAAVSAVSTDNTQTTIELVADASSSALSIAANKNITLELAGYTYTSGTITVAKGATLNLNNGTLKSYALTNNGTVAITNMTMSGGSISAGTGTTSITGSDITLTSNQTFTYTPTDDTITTTYTGKGNVTFQLDGYGAASVTGLASGVSFTATRGDDTISYAVTAAGITATKDNQVKVWTGGNVSQTDIVSMSDLAFSGDKFAERYIISSGKLSISSSDTALAAMTASTAVPIISDANFSNQYGTITRNADGSFKVDKTGATSDFASITVANGITAAFDQALAGTVINVGTSSVATTFTASGNDFSVKGTAAVTSITGDVNVSLGTGTITAVDNQTVNAGSYTLSGYGGGDDGLSVAISGSTTQLGDIDVGESFNVNGTVYTRRTFGLTTSDNSNVNKLYTGSVTTASDGAITVNLASLASGMRPFIMPDDSTLVLGGDNTYSAVVLDDNTSVGDGSSVIKYAELTVNNNTNAYDLTTLSGANTSAFQSNVSTISVTGGATTINKSLVGDNMIISTNTASFIVTKSSTTFTVSGTDSAPAVTNATAIKLLSGNITATAGQTITLGDIGKSIVLQSGSADVDIKFTDNVATITAPVNAYFYLDDKPYRVLGGNGMTITASSDLITISDLAAADSDAFTFNGSNYSLKGAGFVRDGNSLWNSAPAVHTIPGSVTVPELVNTANWGALATVRTSDHSISLAATNDTITLVGGDFQYIYGTFSKDSNGTYLIDTVESAASVKSVTLPSLDLVSLPTALTNVTISAPIATLAVTDTDDSNGYLVTLSGNANAAASVSSGEHVTLIGGTLRADSLVTVAAQDNDISANDDAIITFVASSSDATLSLANEKSFNIANRGTYSLASVGLITHSNDTDYYLLGSRTAEATASVVLSRVTNSDCWGQLVNVNAVTVSGDSTNALIVGYDDNSLPQTIYADYTASSRTFSKLSAYEAWPDNATINVDSTDISLTSDFAGVDIHAVASGARFTTGDKTAYKVYDNSTAASVTGATNINLTAGNFSPYSTQIVTTPNHTLKSASGVIVCVDDSTSIGAIDTTGDVFTFDGTTYTNYGVGLMDAGNKLLTADVLTATGLISAENLQLKTNWTDTATLTASDTVLNIPPKASDDNTWIIINTGKTAQFGTLTADGATYTIAKGDNATFSVKASISGAAFSTDSDTKTFTVTDSTSTLSGAVIGTATTVTQTAGVIAPQANQTIVVGSNSITGAGSDVLVSVSSSAATVSGLDSGDEFSVNGTKYTLLSNGRLQRDDGYVWRGNTITSSIAVSTLLAGNWNSLITTGADFTIDTSVVADLDTAFVVSDTDITKIYGTLTKGTSGYSLTTTGNTGQTLTSITVANGVSPVSISGDFKDVTINAGTTATFTSTNDKTFAVNYDGSAVTVSNATALTLQSGTLTLSDAAQVVTANNHTITAKAGTVTADNGTTLVTVGSIDEQGDSVTIDANTYTFSAGDGISVLIDDITHISGITTGDVFTIGSDTFRKTTAGFIKNDSYLWTNTDEGEGDVDVSRLIANAKGDWTSLNAHDGTVTIDTSSEAGILISSDGTTVFGELFLSGNVYTIAQYASNDTIPTKIILKGVTCTLTEPYADTPVELVDGTVTWNGNTISGTLDTVNVDAMKFTPAVGDNFTIADDASYVMTGAGLTKSGYIWTTAGTTEFTLPATNWTKYFALSSGTLNLTQFAPDASNIIVNEDSSSRLGTLTYSTGSYSFSGSDIGTIQLPAGDATVSANFATTLTTGKGTFTVNGDEYAGTSALTVDVATDKTTLNTGTVTIAANKSATADTELEVTAGEITATASAGNWSSLGNLSDGDTFTFGGNSYQVVGNKTLVQLSGSTIAKIHTDDISSTLAIGELADDKFTSTLMLTADGNLDLSGKPDAGIVIAYNDAATRIGTLAYANSTYTLTPDKVSTLTGITLSRNAANIVTNVATTVTTSTGTYSVNGVDYSAASALTIDATTTASTLNTGTIDVSGTAYATKDAITGSGITATASNGSFTSLGSVGAGDTFTYSGADYLMTSAGLTSSGKINRSASSTIATDDLTPADWDNIITATDDAATIANNTGAGIIADISSPTAAVVYGTVSYSNGSYSLASERNLNALTIDSAQVTFNAGQVTSITAGGATFGLTGSDVTVNSRGGLSISGATAITLDSGTVTASAPVTSGGYRIVSTSGTITVTNDGTVTVGNIDIGDTFTVNGTAYERTATGLYQGTRQVTSGVTDSTFTPADAGTAQIIAPDGSTLDLRNITSDAVVYDSASNPQIQLATLEVSGELTLTGSDYASRIKSIKLADGASLIADFSTQATASGIVTVNGSTFTGKNLIIDITSNDATLNAGTVDVDGTVTATRESLSGNGITASVASGRFSSLTGLDLGESFTFGGNTYTRTNLGLSTGNRLTQDFSSSVDLSKLAAATWYNVIDAGTIDLDAITADSIVVSGSSKVGTVSKSGTTYTLDFNTQATASASVTVNGSNFNGSGLSLDVTKSSATLNAGTVTVNGTCTATNDSISGNGITATASNGKFTVVTLATGESFTYGGTTYTQTALGLTTGNQIRQDISGNVTLSDLASGWENFISPTNGTINLDDATTAVVISNGTKLGNLTADGTTYTLDFPIKATTSKAATVNGNTYNGTNLTLDVTADSSTLNTGTVNVNGTVAATNDSITGNGFSATAAGGKFTNVSGLDLGESFTYGGTTYTQTALGLTTGNQIREDISGTVDLNTLANNWSDVISPTNGTINLDGATTAVVISNGTKLGNLTADGTTYTLDFPIKATTSKAATVNGVTFNGTNLTLDVTADSSTLNTGTVTVNGTVAATNDSITGNGLSATAAGGKFTNVSGLDSGKSFTYDGTTYTQTNLGLTTGNQIREDISGTVELSSIATGWQKFISPTNGTINLDDATTAVVISNGTKLGNLTADGTTYTLNFPIKATTSKAATVNGVTFNGSNLTLDVTKSSATLNSGTVNVNGTVTATNDSITGDGITATASNGKFTAVDGLDLGESFTFGGTTYTQTNLGLVAGDKIHERLGGTTIELAKLGSGWYAIASPTGGVLNLNGATSAIIIDSGTKLGKLTVSGNVYTLDFPIKATLSGTGTVNGQSYTGTDLTLDVTATSSTLNTGTVEVNGSVTANETISGTNITATARNGQFETIGSLDGGDRFTRGGNSYKMISGVGLLNTTGKRLVTEGLDGQTLYLDLMEESEITAPMSGVLNLNGASSSIVLDSTSEPTKRLGRLTVDGTSYTLDFATRAKTTEAGRVNGRNYNPTNEITLAVTATESALRSGTVSLTSGESVTTSGGETISVRSSGGGSLLRAAAVGGVNVTVQEGKTYLDITAGATFLVDGEQYRAAPAGLVNAAGKLYITDYGETIATDELTAADNWQVMIAAPDGNIYVDANTLANGTEAVLVDSTSYPSAIYAYLERDGDGKYTLSAGEDTPNSITVSGTQIDIANAFADVPITAVNADGTETTFTVTPKPGQSEYTLDASGTSPKIEGVSEVEVSKGSISAGEGIPVTPSAEAEDVQISAGNGTHKIGGETVVIDGQGGNVDFGTDSDGQLNSISGLDKGATVTIDGTTYTAPADDSTLRHTAADDWYFEDYTPARYVVTVDANGNVAVETGVKFSDVISSGRTTAGGNITFAADYERVPITVVNKSDALGIIDKYGVRAAGSVPKVDALTFDEEGISAAELGSLTGATITLVQGQTLTAGESTISGASKVTIGRRDVLTVDGTITGANVTIDLGGSNATVNGLKLTGEATATLDDGGAITVTSGADIIGQGKVTFSGTITANGNTITTDAPTTVDLTAHGLNDLTVTGDTSYTVNITGGTITSLTDIGGNVTVTGLNNGTITTDEATALTIDKTFTADEGATFTVADGRISAIDGATTVTGDFSEGVNVNGTTYQIGGGTVTIADGTIYADGKTIYADAPTGITLTSNGLTVGNDNLTVTGDTSYTVNISGGAITSLSNIGGTVTISSLNNGTITTDEASTLTVDKTFTADEGATFTVADGKISGIDGATTITGDFSGGVNVNGTRYRISGEATITGTTIATAAGTHTINGKTYTTTTAATYTTAGGTVTGVELQGDGELTVYQDEENFRANDDTLNLRGNGTVALGISGGKVTEAIGVSGAISGLSAATVYDITAATINGTALDVTAADVIIESGEVTKLTNITDGATITTAPNMTLTTAGNGAFTFGESTYNINDTVDGSVDIITDAQSRAADITNFAGSISGALENVAINGNTFATNGHPTLTTDGADITGVYGVASGDSLSGDIGGVSIAIPEGTVTVNGAAFELAGDADGVTLTDNAITGFANGATVTVGTAGEYVIDAVEITAAAGDAYTTNRDGLYRINPNHKPISEQTPASEIPANVQLIESDGTYSAGNAAVRNNANATVEVADAATITAVSGRVTLENYNDNADIVTYDYSDIGNAIMSGAITFGNGVMTLGDAVVTFDESAAATGATLARLIDATGRTVPIGFTHTAGGAIDVSGTNQPYLLKGNYAANATDTQKSGASTLTGGSGNDTLLIGGGDQANAGAGNNQIYITDPNLRGAPATIVLSAGKTTVKGFGGGFTAAADQIQIGDLEALEYGYGAAGLTLTSGEAELTFSNSPAKVKLTDGTGTKTAQFAPSGQALSVDEAADIFYANANGITFAEYAGTVAVNLNTGKATLNGSAAQIVGTNVVEAGAGNATLIGADATNNTLIAGTGNAVITTGSASDLLVGNTSDAKTGYATFGFSAGNGHDTITNFDFMANSGDVLSDEIYIDTARNVLTDIHLSGSDVIIGLNNSASDVLTVTDAKGKHMRVDGLVAKVDTLLTYDGFTDCYVGGVANSTLQVTGGGNFDICLGEATGTQYIGDITILDASDATGSAALIGNELNNLIIGGTGANSIWGGDHTNDTLVGGAGQNTFFFALENGNDIITNAHDGDIIDLTSVWVDDVARADVTSGGVTIELNDGSRLDVQSAANVEFRLADATYTADHSERQFVMRNA